MPRRPICLRQYRIGVCSVLVAAGIQIGRIIGKPKGKFDSNIGGPGDHLGVPTVGFDAEIRPLLSVSVDRRVNEGQL
jgi:hypothetical protein